MIPLRHYEASGPNLHRLHQIEARLEACVVNSHPFHSGRREDMRFGQQVYGEKGSSRVNIVDILWASSDEYLLKASLEPGRSKANARC